MQTTRKYFVYKRVIRNFEKPLLFFNNFGNSFWQGRGMTKFINKHFN